VSYKPKFLNENGIVFVSANYRLSPPAKHPTHISDVAAAVRWVYDHAAEIGASPKKIVVMGHSCGCHLVTLLALDPRWLAGVKLSPDDLRGVVAWSGGAYDLVAKVMPLAFGAVVKDVGKGSDRSFTVTRIEFDLLELLLRHPRQVLTRELILDRVWGYTFDSGTNSLAVYVGYLRRKTEEGGEARLIHTARGVGYVLREP